ncbi:uncharacterized protein LOC142571760 isoform X2 [Dermacentor variabilis]|uniref:uncharacterized protein LOC142571760 isoform X2 n=1 Tax=Dermacentor variabilis TaxID=34621 RepID=UPI003F5C6B9C
MRVGGGRQARDQWAGAAPTRGPARVPPPGRQKGPRSRVRAAACFEGPRRADLHPASRRPAGPSDGAAATTCPEAMDTSRSLLLSLAALALLGPAVTSAFYRGRPGSSLALAKRLETELAEDEEYTALPGTLEAFEWRSRFPPALPADVSSFYPFFRPASLAKKNNKDAPRSLDPAGANRKFQTQGWRR